jgi:hypothetical protein
LLDQVSRFIGWVLIVYLYFRFWDTLAMNYTHQPGRTEGLQLLTTGALAFTFWIGEILLGALVPMIILLSKRLRSHTALHFLALVLSSAAWSPTGGTRISSARWLSLTWCRRVCRQSTPATCPVACRDRSRRWGDRLWAADVHAGRALLEPRQPPPARRRGSGAGKPLPCRWRGLGSMMSEFNAALVMIALFALRCVVPLALTLGLGYVMNRLVDRWERRRCQAGDRGTRSPAGAGITSGAIAG